MLGEDYIGPICLNMTDPCGVDEDGNSSVWNGTHCVVHKNITIDCNTIVWGSYYNEDAETCECDA